jgi:hypothetical protein
LTLGVVFGLRLRQAEGLLESVLQLMRLALAVPDHTTLSHRATQVHHRAAFAGPVASRSADRSRHRLRRPQPNACRRTPEICPPQGSHGLVCPFKNTDPFKAGSMHQSHSA